MILDILSYVLLLAVLAGAGYVGYVFLRSHLNGGNPGGSLFGPKPEKRLDVVEQWSLDARRRLVLIRRDNVEHLIMTGGPIDLIIETGIGEPVRKASQPPAPPTGAAAEPAGASVYSRPGRTMSVPAQPVAANSGTGAGE
jgi:flagellar protein FliO/FliZ